MLNEHALVDYLIDHKFILPESVVSDGFTILNASRRNHNFKVLTPDGPCYMIKQGGEQGSGLGSLSHEATTYQFLSESTTQNSCERFIPQLYRFDVSRNLLILELTANAENLRSLQTRRRSFSRLLARHIGRGLSAIHSIPISHEGRRFETPYHPWAIALGLPGTAILYDISGANLVLLKTIQKYPEFGRQLKKLQDEWESTSLIHGDFKWENCIGYSPPGSNRTTRLRIVDWEFAGVGDPCWDIGSVFGDYLSTWLTSIPLTGDSTPERWVELAAFPLEKMHPAINAFWRAYRKSSKLSDADALQKLVKSIRYCAARLLQTSYEHMQQSIALNGHVYCCLQLALNLLERPAEAGVHLLGLPVYGAFES